MKYPVNGTQINVLEQGSGTPALVFLHYFGGSAREWQNVMNQLSGQHRCLAIDLRGHGNSDAPATGYAVNDMADDVAGVLGVCDVQDYVLVGHSMSGKVALALASRQPVGLRSLLLVSPSPPLPEPLSDTDRQTLLAGHGKPEAAEHTFRNIVALPVSKATRAQIIADDLRTAKTAWNAWLLQGSREDISARVSSIIVPVHLIAGSEDRALPPPVQTSMTLPYLTKATLTIIDGAGHLPPWEAPDELVKFIRKNLASHSIN